MGGEGGKNIRLISEPEAAAVYTLKAIQTNALNVGDNFVVCDAGGGTVVGSPSSFERFHIFFSKSSPC